MREKPFETDFNDAKSGYVFTIGADPEFIFVGANNRITPAGSLFRGNRELSSRFGTDGCASIAEVRPMPSVDPLDVVNSMESIMKNCPANAKTLRWVAGSYKHGYNIGGHVHISIKVESDRRNLADLLDYYVGNLVAMVENPSERRSRLGAGFGGGSIRECSWGRGLEWRTPASWLTDKKIATAVLCMVKTIVWEYYNGNRELITNNMGRYHNDVWDNNERKQAEMKKIWKTLKLCKLYRYNRWFRLMYPLRKMVERNQTWDNNDFKVNWSLGFGESRPVRQVAIDRAWEDL